MLLEEQFGFIGGRETVLQAARTTRKFLKKSTGYGEGIRWGLIRGSRNQSRISRPAVTGEDGEVVLVGKVV